MNHSNAEIKPFEYSYYDYDSWYNNAEPTKPPKEWVQLQFSDGAVRKKLIKLRIKCFLVTLE